MPEDVIAPRTLQMSPKLFLITFALLKANLLLSQPVPFILFLLFFRRTFYVYRCSNSELLVARIAPCSSHVAASTSYLNSRFPLIIPFLISTFSIPFLKPLRTVIVLMLFPTPQRDLNTALITCQLCSVLLKCSAKLFTPRARLLKLLLSKKLTKFYILNSAIFIADVPFQASNAYARSVYITQTFTVIL